MKFFQLSHRTMSTIREVTGKVRHQKIVAVETEIYSPRINNEIYYRGYSVRDLTRKCNFMEVAHLLTKGNIPSESECTEFNNEISRGATDVTSLVYKVQELLPTEAHAADVISASLSLLNAAVDDSKAANFEKILGECLAIISRWRLGITASDLQTSDMIMDFFARSLCRIPLKELDEDMKRLINTIAILYMEHGLTSASYAARLCISEQGTVYSAIINALATHRSCVPMFSWREFDEIFGVSETEKDAIIAKFKEDRCLPKQFRDFVLPDKDPRTDILLEHCSDGSLDQIIDMQQRFDGKCHFRFDVFIFHLIRKLCDSHSDATISSMQIMLLMPRIVGWISHIAEQQKIKRRIEHIAAYVGPHPKQLTTKTST